MSEEPNKPSKEQKKIAFLQLWLSVVIICLVISLLFNLTSCQAQEKSQIGVVHPETDEVSGETIDIVNAGYFWVVYNDVDTEKSQGTIYSLFSEEEIIKLLMDEVLELEYSAVSSPSSESTRYRIENPSSEGKYIWVEAPAPVEEEVIPDTTGEITG